MMDRDLKDDMLKLVRYMILFVKRDLECAFDEKEELVSDNIDSSAFTAWKIAEFIQLLRLGKVRVPDQWRSYYPPEQYRANGYLIGLPEEDNKYLRVYFEVLERYPREMFKYEEQQIKALEDIRGNGQ